MGDDDKALDAVIKDMGVAARSAKARRFQAKFAPKAATPSLSPEGAREPVGEMLSEAELQQLLEQQRHGEDSEDETKKLLEVQR